MKYISSAAAILSLAMLTSGLTVHASGALADGNYGTTGDVKFKASVEPENPLHPENPDPSKPVIPVNPLDPEKPLEPGTEGPLSIDFVSNFQFGEQKISTKNEKYYAHPQEYIGGQDVSANYMQVTDKRGTSEGWSLSVAQVDNFTATSETENKELKGLELKLAADQGVINSISDSDEPVAHEVILSGAGTHGEIFSASRLAGTGTWTSTIGQLINNPNEEQAEDTPLVNEGVELTIPGDVQTDAVTYSTTLNWTLEQKPQIRRREHKMKIVKLGAVAALLASGVAVVGTEANAETKTYGTTGDITFEQSTEPELPVYPGNPDPENPVKPTDPTDPNGPGPGTQGPISIDYVSSLDFGKQEISNKKEVYFAKPQTYETGQADSPNYMQVTDKSGKVAGWRLSVEQKTDFTAQSANATNKTIVGAEITLNAGDGEVASNGNSVAPAARNVTLTGAGSTQSILAAEVGKGAGLWTATLGDLETVDGEIVNTGASLMIPGSSQTDADKYSTALVWKIENVPGFE